MLFDENAPFSTPKPTRLLELILKVGTTPASNDIVLDFFAGSGSFGHAVMALNQSDGGSRRFILVQLPEPLDSDDKNQKVAAEYCDVIGRPRNIAELAKERLRRAGEKIRSASSLIHPDLGFRVFKLDQSNIIAWAPDSENIHQSLLQSIEHIRVERTDTDVLYELIVRFGIDLCVPIETKSIAGKSVISIGSGALLVCLAPQIEKSQMETLASGIVTWHKQQSPAGESTIVFRDSAFADDVTKTNITAILQQHGLENVRSL
jgi:adenine-specific DNA-methyltransferase